MCHHFGVCSMVLDTSDFSERFDELCQKLRRRVEKVDFFSVQFLNEIICKQSTCFSVVIFFYTVISSIIFPNFFSVLFFRARKNGARQTEWRRGYNISKKLAETGGSRVVGDSTLSILSDSFFLRSQAQNDMRRRKVCFYICFPTVKMCDRMWDLSYVVVISMKGSKPPPFPCTKFLSSYDCDVLLVV